MKKRRNFSKFTDWAPDPRPFHVMYKSHPKCPKCGDFLELISVKTHWFPYIHVDIGLKCVVCNKVYAFGIPQNRHAGLSLIIWDSNPFEAVKAFDSLGKRFCPFKHGEMLPTKVFGDWIPDSEEVEYQWKCPVCFLTHHEVHKRNFRHGEANPLSKEEREMIKERLKELGYIK